MNVADVIIGTVATSSFIKAMDSLAYALTFVFIGFIFLYALVYLPLRELTKVIKRRLKEKQVHDIHFYEKPQNISIAQIARALDKNTEDGYRSAFLATVIDLQQRDKFRAGANDADLKEYEVPIVKGLVAIKSDDKKPFLEPVSERISIPINYLVNFDMHLEMEMMETNPARLEFITKLVNPLSLKIMLVNVILFGIAGFVSGIEKGEIASGDFGTPIVYLAGGFGIFVVFFSVILKITDWLHGSNEPEAIEDVDLGVIYGYKEYLEKAEKERIEFQINEQDEKLENPHICNAIALDVVKVKDMDSLLKRINSQSYAELLSRKSLPPDAEKIDEAPEGLL